MAGHVTTVVRKWPDVHKSLLGGTTLWRWEENDQNMQKLTFKADKDGFFLYARGEDQGKVYDSFIWDFTLVSDVRSGKPPPKSNTKLLEAMTAVTGSDSLEDLCLTLVHRRDGIVNVDNINLLCEWPETTETFKNAVNALTFNLLFAHATPSVFFRKSYVRILLHANGHGHIHLRYIHKALLLRSKIEIDNADSVPAFNNIIRRAEDGTTYVEADKFTEAIFLQVIERILRSRADDLDVVLTTFRSGKARRAVKGLSLEDFHRFLNTEQRDPRLNEILHPLTSKDQSKKFISRHEKGKVDDKLTPNGLMSYLVSEENCILNLDHLDQHMDMYKPMSHYFINSSHNTYLAGHQLKSASTSEMYIQALLLGCRCLELDCWPSSDNESIVITHGGTLCGKVAFKEVVEAINQFAFVRSDYPLILSIENHCKSRPHLIQQMVSIFVVTFGDKLVKAPFDDLPLEPGVPLPSPERLKGRILLKDKVKRQKGDATLQRGMHTQLTIDEVPEEERTLKEEEDNKGSDTVEIPHRDTEEKEEKTDGEEGSVTPTANGTEGKEEKIADEEETKTQNGRPKSGGRSASTLSEDSLFGKPKTSRSSSSFSVDSLPGKAKSSRSASVPSFDDPFGGTSSPFGTPAHKKMSESELSGIDEINVSMLPRPSEVEALVSGPLIDLLNYCTGISFEGFTSAERLNCSFYMSSFVEEKGLGLIKTQPKEYVKYNMRQLSRIYPQGTRINSSNYMPQIYWNVGCQLVALNYQTSDLPLQLNHAKFEFNGGTGFLTKPWVLLRERKGVAFSPFIQSRQEDIVPARLTIRIISGYFLTDKKTICYAEAELYGLPADTLRHKYYTKKLPAPHPFWNEEGFTFKRILLPELAMLRVAVFDDDRELVGQRFLPVNAIRPGFRHIPLRDKHGQPQPMAMLFVHVKVEDWVPNEMEEVVAALMDPISFATKALEELAKGEFEDNGTGEERKGSDSALGLDLLPKITGPNPRGSPLPSPKHAAFHSQPKPSGQAEMMGLPPQLPTSSSGQNISGKTKTLPLSRFDDSLPALDIAKERPQPKAVEHNSRAVMEHPEYLKLQRKSGKQRMTITKKHEKVLKPLHSKLAKKGADEAIKKSILETEAQQKAELLAFDKKMAEELHARHIALLDAAHKTQLRDLEKTHKEDTKAWNQDLMVTLRKHRKNSDFSDRRAGMSDIEDRTIELGKKMKTEFDRLHSQERTKLEQAQKDEMEELAKFHAKELAGIDSAAIDEATTI